MADNEDTLRLTYYWRKAEQAEANAEAANAGLRDTWNGLAASWHALATELQQSLEHTCDAAGSIHLLKKQVAC